MKNLKILQSFKLEPLVNPKKKMMALMLHPLTVLCSCFINLLTLARQNFRYSKKTYIYIYIYIYKWNILITLLDKMSNKVTQRLIVILQAKPDKLFGCLVSKNKKISVTLYLGDFNWTRINNQLVRKQALILANLAKWLKMVVVLSPVAIT